MTDRDILIEILAIQIFLQDNGTTASWYAATPEDRQEYRDIVARAGHAEDIATLLRGQE